MHEILEHQALIDFLEEESERRNLKWNDLSERMGLHPSQLYQIRSHRRPGLSICLAIARYTHHPVGFILYLAGHITEAEFRKTADVPPEVLPILEDLEILRGSPAYLPTVKLLRQTIDTILYKLDLPEG